MGAIANRRMARAWHVNETGAMGSVKVAIPAGSAAYGPVYLLVSSDDTFDSTDQWIQLTSYTGGSTPYVAADFDFRDGQYFICQRQQRGAGQCRRKPEIVAEGGRRHRGIAGHLLKRFLGRGNDANIRAGAAQNLVASAITSTLPCNSRGPAASRGR